MKREDYISFDEYFMALAKLTAMRSKDPNTQVGACIVSPDNRIFIGTKDGIQKGTYEILEFKTNYLSDPLINYTLEGQEHLGNTNGVKYYNSRSIYILDKENKVLNKCPKYGELCDPRKIDIDLKNITQSESKYLKNIQ